MQQELPRRFERPVFRAQQKTEVHLNLILLDTSGSNLHRKALDLALQAINGLCHSAYLQRQQCTLITFGNNKVETLLRPQRGLKNLATKLQHIQAGGGTPLRTALLSVQHQVQKNQLHSHQSQTLYLFSDGRSQDHLDDINLGCPTVLIDTELSAVKLGKMKQLAKTLGAKYIPLAAIATKQTGKHQD